MPWTRKTACLALAVFFSMQINACSTPPQSDPASNKEAASSVQSTLDEVQKILISDASSGQFHFKRAASILTEGIDRNPDSYKLLKKRANIYVQLHDYKRAMADLRRAKKIKHLPPTIGLALCMLIDRTHGYSHEAKTCYARIAGEFEKKHVSDSAPSVNYVIAALMAGSPRAESIKHSYLTTHSSNSPTYDLVKHFDRESYIHEIMP